MAGTVIFSHGHDSGPDATKTAAMGEVADSRGWRVVHMDYRDLDPAGLAACVDPRIDRLREAASEVPGDLVLAGSSMGAFVSGLVSRDLTACRGLFLLALPVLIPEYWRTFEMKSGVPVTMIHGFEDETCPWSLTLAVAQAERARLLLVPDGHRLAEHVDWIARQFGLYLESVGRAA